MNSPGRLWLLLLALGPWLVACDDLGEDLLPYCPGDGAAMAEEVDPFIGTQGSGNAIPGALMPHGMVKLSPDTVVESMSVDAYEYNSSLMEGFSHTHLEGPGGGANGYSHILLLPTTGALNIDPQTRPSHFSHLSEQAEPGYYAVSLSTYGVRAELTASAHAGLHRYSYPAQGPARVLLDLGHSRGESRGGWLQIEGDHIRGMGEYNVHPLLDLMLSSPDDVTGRSRVYFYASFQPPFESFGCWPPEGGPRAGQSRAEGAGIGAWVEFPDGTRRVEVRVGISFIDEAQAQRHHDQELARRDFEQVRSAAASSWRCALGRIEVEGGEESQRRSFATALYRSLFQPADLTESGGAFYSGADGQGQVFADQGFRFFADDWCSWDTFRTAHPLATLLAPERVEWVLASYLHLYRQGGWLPKCTWHATGYSRVMIGNHALPILADALAKGFSVEDPEELWQAVAKACYEDNEEDAPDGLCGYANLGTPADYRDLGYVSSECDPTQSVSMTLEYAYNDWTAARIAEVLGKEAEAAALQERSFNWREHWDAETGFMRPRYRSGNFVAEFDPADDSQGNDFCEANSWIYSWFVPHDVEGLMAAMGGREAFVQRLDQFFDEGYFDVSNEPSFHVPFLYNLAGQPWKSQARVRQILAEDFSDQPDGLPGNDDAGATSAWYVLASMGLYPIAPGDGRYQIVSPLFERVTIHLHPRYHDGDRFVIETEGLSPDAVYIQSAELNGQALERSWISHEEISAGGSLRLLLGPEPSDWARGREADGP